VTQEQRRRIITILLPPLLTAVAVLATSFTQTYLPRVLLPFFILAVTVAALFGGTSSGAATLLLSLLAFSYWFLDPVGSLVVNTDLSWARLISFLAVALPVVFLGGRVYAHRLTLARQTDRQREVEAALRAREAELADVFETASIAIHWVASDGTILRANQAELDLLGYERDEYVGRNIGDFHVDREGAFRLLRRLMAGERVQQHAEQLRCKDGRILDVLIDSSGYFQDGRFVHSRCFTRDVTAEKQSHDAVSRLAAIVASSSDAIMGKTLDGVLTNWNAAAERIFGYTADEIVGQSIFTLVPPELHDLERDILERLRRGESVELLESERIRKDGRRIWISLSVSPIRDASGALMGAASIMRDITDRKQLQEHLHDAQRLQAVGQLAGGMAHEANNQMSVVLGGAHFLLRRTDLPESARQDVEQIRQAAERTAFITQQLLAFGRRQLLQPQDIELDEVIKSLAPVLRRTLRENQDLVIETRRPGGRIHADPRQIQQVLLNLTLNARDALTAGGRLTLRTEGRTVVTNDARRRGLLPGSYEVLVVSDNGSGMDEATLERAFEPFFTTRDVGQGTGLGLSVVHGIVHQSGGRIEVDSEVGRGTTFRLYFPAAESSAAAEPGEDHRTASPGAGRAVLLVEDEGLVRRMAARALGEAGYQVLEAENGRAALELAARYGPRIELVLTDVGMPEMDGHELARRLEELRPDLPVVFLTGWGERDHRSDPAPATVRAVLRKPFSPDSLVQAVEQVLGEHE
jgi:PAS domain S-box-containing protein